MQMIPKGLTFAASAIIAWLATSGSALAQQTLTVSPSVVSNTYVGVVTLNITGLTNGEQVTVQKWMDLNGNGVIDAGEPMMDAFKIADNDLTSNLIGGVTNVNIPADSNPTNGTITTTLSFAGNLNIENVTGHYIFRVVSPSGRFLPVSASFVVTNAALAQSISGTVYANGSPFPFGVVVAQDQQANNPAGGAIADVNGNYSVTLPPGNYSLIGAYPNYFYDQSAGPSVVLTNGMAATANVYLTNGSVTISGNIYNAANSNSIGGLLLTLGSGNLFAIAFTDTNGNYSAAVSPSVWKIQPSKERLPRRAYVLPQAKFQVDTTTNSVTNANIALPKGNALFYGRITDNASAPFANVEVETDANNGNDYAAKGYSDTNGNYAVAVLGLTNEIWNCGVNSGAGTPLANYVLNQFGEFALVTNQTVQLNYVALPATSQIHGRVTDNFGNPVSGLALSANANIGGNNYGTLDGNTDNSGNYSLAVANGFWSVQFLNGTTSSDNIDARGYEDLLAPHNVTIPPTNVTLNLTIYPIGTPFITQFQRVSSSQVNFNVNGASNVNYTVQFSTNLAATNWSTLESFQLTTNPFPVVDTHATNSLRFYRVQKN
jgi:hypothetical protein